MKRPHGQFSFAILLVLSAVFVLGAYQHDRATVLLVAAVNRHDATRVEALLRQGADPNARDWKTYYGRPGTPFVPPWYEKPLALLMRRKPRPAGRYIGPTVLMIAAFHGDIGIVRTLLDHGADMMRSGTGLEISAFGMDGLSTPTYEAVVGRNVPTALLMIRRGTAVTNNAKGEYGNPPLLEAAQPEVAAALIDCGAEVNSKNDDGWTPLIHGACDMGLVGVLLDRGADVNAMDNQGDTPLSRACMGERVDTAKLLLARGAKVNLCKPLDDPPLILAAQGKNLGMLKLLLSYGANVNAQGGSGETALMLVSYPGFAPCLPPHSLWRSKRRAMQMLLRRYGANPFLKDKEGKTAADYETEVDPGQVCGP